MKHKLAFIGPTMVHEAFKDMDETWDMQVPLETLEIFEQELTIPAETARISKDTSVIIFFSRLFNKNPEKFAELVAYTAPYSVICILIPQADLHQKSLIEQSIKQAQIREAQQNPDYNSNTPFYFTVYENAQVEIFSAIEDFVKSPIILQEVKDSIRTMLPVLDIPMVEQFEDFGDYSDDEEQIYIPDADPTAKGQVIAVTSSKGGSGKSTVSMCLGAYIRAASKDAAANGLTSKALSVCFVDLDVRDGQLGFLNGALKPTILDILYLGEPTTENIKSGIYHSNKLDCDFIFAAKRPKTAKTISPNFYAQLIQNLRSIYDIIILDTSVNYLDPLLEEVAYPIADKIILVSDMGLSSVFGCSRWINETIFSSDIVGKPIDKNKVGVVINKAMQDVNMGPGKLEKAMKGLPIISMIPSVPTIFTYAANTNELGQMLNIEAINKSFKNIAEAIIEEPLGNVPFGQ